MHDSSTIAEVGSMLKVSGSRIATPFGPPRPGSTPTKMPSTSPTIINEMVFHVIRTAKPCSKSVNASMILESKQGFKRPLRHDDVKRDFERDEHSDRKHKAGDQRFPQ